MDDKLAQIKNMLQRGLESFDNDPADNDYTEGYEEALRDVLEFVQFVEVSDV